MLSSPVGVNSIAIRARSVSWHKNGASNVSRTGRTGAPCRSNRRRLPEPMRLPRQAPPRYRAPSRRGPTVLIMNGPERLYAQPGGTVILTAPAQSVLATRKPTLLLRLSVVFLLRFAERRFCGLLFQEPPRRTRRHGAVQAPGRNACEARRRKRYAPPARTMPRVRRPRATSSLVTSHKRFRPCGGNPRLCRGSAAVQEVKR